MNRKKKRWLFGNMEPKAVDGQFADRTSFYKEFLYRTVCGLLDIDCPADWDKSYLLHLLLREGYFIVTDSSVGVKPFRSSLYGFNYTNFPVEAIVSVPNLHEFTRKLSINAEIVYLDYEYGYRSFFNVDRTIRIYAEKLASCDSGIDVNILNSKVAFIVETENKAQAETIKALYDRISEGEPLVVYRKDSISTNPLQLLTNNVKNTFIVPELQDSKRTILNEFLSLWGINNNNTDKKERLITPEVNANIEELVVNIGQFERNLRECSEKVRDMFHIDFNISFKYGEKARKDMENDTMRDGIFVEGAKRGN